MMYFVKQDSIVRKIWGDSDTVLLIFAGASAEFALNKAVDWLYFTGRLPADPLGRLFSTVAYARKIVFSEKSSALHTIDTMTEIHRSVEEKRGTSIPDWAYRDVLFMLIDYSIRSFEVLERKLNKHEKNEVFNVFYRLGSRMKLKELPDTFGEWKKARQKHLEKNLRQSHYTDDLYAQYRKHLGAVRYLILLEAQSLIAPKKVCAIKRLRKISLLLPLIRPYKFCKSIRAEWILRRVLLPARYKKEIKLLNRVPN